MSANPEISQTDRNLEFHRAINEALDVSLTTYPNTYLIGLGVPDPKGVFGTTLGLQQKHGPDRVMDMPTSENGMTGVAIGAALVGARPIMVHQRVDFFLLAMDQLVNQAAKWHYMFGGQCAVPITIRLIIGRGWGQGAQHSQSLQSWFAHVPGLKVVMPSTPYDAKGLLIASVEDNNPVVILEYRWLYSLTGHVPEGRYTVPLGKARVVSEGSDITIAATSYMTIESLQAAKALECAGINAEVIDIRTLSPLDEETIMNSVKKTGRLIVADTGWKKFGIAGEIVSRATEECFQELKVAPQRVAMPDCPMPSTPALANLAYPRARDIAKLAAYMMGRELNPEALNVAAPSEPLDVPNKNFTGPF